MRHTVITSIYPPGKAVEGFASLEGNHVVIAGDHKTPSAWSHSNCSYLSPADQEALDFKMIPKLPWNHYCRKMLGYLYAIREGAAAIFDTDDDNIPYEDYETLPSELNVDTTQPGLGFVNVYQWFTDAKIWPRGLPLESILAPSSAFRDDSLLHQSAKVGVWQGLADLDPDVDAIYRLTSNEPVTFRKASPVVLAEGTWCPFNSQNTLFLEPSLFPLLYLPAHVTFRFTDILRGYVAQPILQAAGFQLGFHQATVYQERNAHNLMQDFKDEIPFYLNAQRCMDIACRTVSGGKSVSDNLVSVYRDLYEEGIVPDDELSLLDAWLEDCHSLLG